MATALTIAGSDPTGGAGLQADLTVFTVFGVHGLGVPAALTAQSTEVVDRILPVEEGFLERQLDVLLSDIRPDSLKTGMLYAAPAVEIVARKIKGYGLRNLVIDPVTVSSTGVSLIEDGTLDAMRQSLFPLARVVTPNIYEASLFTGVGIRTESDMEDAARALKDLGPEVVIITGGHLEPEAIDLFYDGHDVHRLEAKTITGDYHGTVCAFSAAIAACLALGHSPLESAKKAKEFLGRAIQNAFHPGKGLGMLGLLK